MVASPDTRRLSIPSSKVSFAKQIDVLLFSSLQTKRNGTRCVGCCVGFELIIYNFQEWVSYPSFLLDMVLSRWRLLDCSLVSPGRKETELQLVDKYYSTVIFIGPKSGILSRHRTLPFALRCHQKSSLYSKVSFTLKGLIFYCSLTTRGAELAMSDTRISMGSQTWWVETNILLI